MVDLVVHPAREPLRGSVPCPPDRRVASVATLIGAVAPTRSTLTARGLPPLAIAGPLQALGVTVAQDADGVTVDGAGLTGLGAPDGPLRYEGDDPIALGALAGILAAQEFSTTLHCDAALAAGAMQAVARVIRGRGGNVEGQLDPARVGVLEPPIVFQPPPGALSEIDATIAIGDGAAKAAALIGGLWATGATALVEPAVVDERVERLLSAAGVPLQALGGMLLLDAPKWKPPLEALSGEVPGDASIAATLAAAGLASGGTVTVRGVAGDGLHASAWQALRDAGIAVAWRARPETLGFGRLDLQVGGGAARPMAIGGELAGRGGVHACAWAALATAGGAGGRLHDLDPAALTLATTTLAAFGVPIHPLEDGLAIGPGRPVATTITCVGAEQAMAAAAIALAADGPSRLRGVDALRGRAPRFVATLRALGARIDVIAEHDASGDVIGAP